jgi:hypothetical protein
MTSVSQSASTTSSPFLRLFNWLTGGSTVAINEDDDLGPSEQIYPGKLIDWKETTKEVQTLWNDGHPREDFNLVWQDASLKVRRHFVTCLDNDKSPQAEEIKKIYITIIYRAFSSEIPHWPSQESDTFYHATPTLDNAVSILKSGKVLVAHGKVNEGAFVATKALTGYGAYVFVFKRYIERLSALARPLKLPYKKERSDVQNGCLNSCRTFYAAGFSQPIPVNQHTLAAVLINSDDFKKDQAALLEVCWHGLRIERYKEAGKTPVPLVPSEWPGSIV